MGALCSGGGNNEDNTTEQKSKQEFLYKVVIVGQINAGKSSLLLKKSQNIFVGEAVATIGDDEIANIMVNVDESTSVKLQVCDTAGQEKFREITISHYRQAKGVMICFSMDDPDAAQHVSDWVNDAQKYSNTSYLFIVCNKSDLTGDDAVAPIDDIKEYAEHEDIPFYAASALTGEGVDEVFQEVGTQIYHQMNTRI
eukprot:TRINITY_DN1906_c0_g1_i1.p1 TRINITY_DN1906_c0_g1~~TRINITY_DN1906_c0_g1_i1.p1  ORF type:complete len:219 (+),score=43.04 TRINITY_DN1906_c0_g1_i1:67-657(+)